MKLSEEERRWRELMRAICEKAGHRCPTDVVVALMRDVDASAGPNECHPWMGQTHRRGTPFTRIPGFDNHANPRRVLFEQHRQAPTGSVDK